MTMPDYSQWSVAELIRGLKNLDGELYPERKQEMARQITLKQDRSSPSYEADHRSVTTRFKAFLFDLIFAFGPYLIVDQVIAYPFDTQYLDLMAMLWFFGYFALFEVFLKKPSPGKQLLNLTVSTTDEQTNPMGSMLLRTAIVTVLFMYSQISDMLLSVLPPYVDNGVVSLLFCVWLYTLYLAVFSPDRTMVHDILSNTLVEDKNNTEQSPPATWHHARIFAGCSVAYLIYSLFYVDVLLDQIDHEIPQTIEQTSTDEQPDTDTNAAPEVPIDVYLQNKITEQLNIRNTVTFVQRKAWSLGKEGTTLSLNFTVWMPLMAWNDSNNKKILDILLAELKITPGYYDEGSITLMTGTSPLTLKQSVELNMP